LIFKGTGIVWDAENNKRLCKFFGGEYKTANVREIRILEAAGYRSVDDGIQAEQGDTERPEVEAEQEDYSEKTVKELRQIARERKIKDYYIMSKDELIEALKG